MTYVKLHSIVGCEPVSFGIPVDKALKKDKRTALYAHYHL